jgi:allophanate hydrolase subunit 1
MGENKDKRLEHLLKELELLELRREEILNDKKVRDIIPITVNTLLVDYNLTELRMDEIETYLIHNKIHYNARVHRDSETDIEIHILVDDIPNFEEFQADLQIEGDISRVDMVIIYNE